MKDVKCVCEQILQSITSGSNRHDCLSLLSLSLEKTRQKKEEEESSSQQGKAHVLHCFQSEER